jgi:ADP-dependent NAD(P)H-hydrate dehydratase / NAD(P)H-hydrate epimerase
LDFVVHSSWFYKEISFNPDKKLTSLTFNGFKTSTVKLFTAEQIKRWDEATLKAQSISSTVLMERAATGCVQWIQEHLEGVNSIHVICGKGNNGGDGLAIARLLRDRKQPVHVYVMEKDKPGSRDFTINLERLKNRDVHFLETADDLPVLTEKDLIIDALFGIGLNKALSSLHVAVIEKMNTSKASRVAVDVPSGMYADATSVSNDDTGATNGSNAIVKADVTLTFQQYKTAFLLQENEQYAGKVVVLDIGLDKQFYEAEPSKFFLVDESRIGRIFKPRKAFAHKGTYGYACLAVGSFGMMGAAVLAAKGCIRSGVGKLRCIVPQVGYSIMQLAVPEAMAKVSGRKIVEHVDDPRQFAAVGVGSGLGSFASHLDMLQKLLKEYGKPMVLDADALNTMGEHKELFNIIPAHSILTPHPKEFERMFGAAENDFAKLKLCLERAKQLNVYIIYKGHHTFIATPEGEGYFNSTGNAGMATGGSGDILLGILTSLLAQGYDSKDAAVFGVYLHGLAGDIAAAEMSPEALMASDIIESLGAAFRKISGYKEQSSMKKYAQKL